MFSDRIAYIVYTFLASSLLWLIACSLHSTSKVEKAHIVINPQRLVLQCAFVVLVVLFCAFREIDLGIGGTDAYGYKLQFLSSTGTLWDQFDRFVGWEPGHAFSLWIVRGVTDNYRIYLVLYYCLLGCMMLHYVAVFSFGRSGWLPIVAIVVFSLESLNTQRNTFAAFMGVMIYSCLRSNKDLKAILLSVVATLIHFGAAIYLIVVFGYIFVKKVKGNYNKKLAIFICGSLIVSIGLCSLFPVIVGGSRLSIYQRNGSLSVPMLSAYLIMLALHFFDKQSVSNNNERNKVSMFYLLFAPMFVFQLYYSIMYRMMLFSIPILYALIWGYKAAFRGKKSTKIIIIKIALDGILLLRILPFFTNAFVDIGVYRNVLL